ncbi:MAG TPA: hypothetical protein VK559_11740 [Ferruginibacter sp.]|nr:hypothetical protein [Ferruginibacter sp.]
MSRSIFIVFIFFTLLFTACKKTDNFSLEPISDYYPLTIGKYITYDLDSIVFTNFGATLLTLDTFHYQVQYVVDGQILDNLNRPAYRVLRYIRTDSSSPWVVDHTDMVVNTGRTIEFTEDNLKFVKLTQPIQNGYSWDGNSYIETTSLISTEQYLANWNYTYDSLNATITLGSLTVDSTLDVAEINQQSGPQDHTDPDNDFYSSTTYSSEKYAKGIGLVYRNFFYDIYQPTSTTSPGYTGYGIILTMTDHN